MEAIGDFEGRTVVVTGGTSGIGWECGRRFAARGATVLVCGIEDGEIERARNASLDGVHVRRLDVRDDAGVRWEAWDTTMLPMPAEVPKGRLIDLASMRW